MNTIFIITAAAIIAGGFITSTSLAADNPAAGPLRGQMFKRIAERLDLTADQKAQIKTILAGEKDTLQSLLGQLHDARKDLRESIQAGNANGQIVAILTPEQRAKFEKLKADKLPFLRALEQNR